MNDRTSPRGSDLPVRGRDGVIPYCADSPGMTKHMTGDSEVEHATSQENEKQRPQAHNAAPAVVDRSTFQAELDALRVRGKAHTREGDDIAAARRRLPIVEVDSATPLIGADVGRHTIGRV